jgi:hypothetical protein
MTDQTTRDFHIGDILSITTGRLVSPRHIDGVYDILNWMTGDNLFTHQLPRAMVECAPALRAQLPTLDTVPVPDNLNENTWRKWMDRTVHEFGEMHPVAPLKAEDHTRINPLAELAMMAPGIPVLKVVIPDGEPPVSAAQEEDQ